MKYKAVFIIPKGSKKELTDVGWEFCGENRLPRDFVARLIQILNLNYEGEDFGMRRYSSDGIKLVVFLDEKSEIEQLYFQCFLSEKDVVSAYRSIENPDVELFVP